MQPKDNNINAHKVSPNNFKYPSHLPLLSGIDCIKSASAGGGAVM
jgi:hypothetical protein